MICYNAKQHSETLKTDPKDTKMNFTEDIKTFEKLPEKSKELHILKDNAEKVTGMENADLHKEIQIAGE